MNTQRLQILIDAYGADPTRWPLTERNAATVLSESGIESALLQQTRRLDAALDDALPAPTLPLGLRARILQALPQPRQPWWQELWQVMGGFRMAGPAFACAFSLGLALVWMLPAPSEALGNDTDLESYLALAWIDPADSEELP